MSLPGGTVGFPVVGGISLAVAQPLHATWLSLDRYSRIVGAIAPPHFWGGHEPNIWPVASNCATVVPRHGWQMPDIASREEILEQIVLAEQDIAEITGFDLAPTFVSNEVHQFPKPYDPLFHSAGGLNTANMPMSIRARHGKIIQAGARTLTKIGTASVAYVDGDADGFAERATITYATTETNACELKAYIVNTAAAPEWEIRQPVKKYLSGGNIVFEFRTWQMVDPDIDARPPAGDYRAVDLSNAANLLNSVDIYREYIDNTVASARFFWENAGDALTAGASTDVGAYTYQDGCTVVRDVHNGLLVPRAATYNATDGIWVANTWTGGRDPDQVRVSYYAGDVSQAFLSGVSCDPLKEKYAKAIAYLATARLSRGICSCPGVLKFFELLQQDTAFSTTGEVFNLALRDLDNPFGTRYGEVMAWRLMGKHDRERDIEVAVL